jgi:peroxiredoxin
MASSDPIHEFDSLRAQTKFVFAVCKSPRVSGKTSPPNIILTSVYRGHWCPFCRGWLSKLATLSPAIIAAGGAPVIITAEAEKYLDDTRAATKYDGKAIVDPENRLAKELDVRGLVHVAISERSGYDHGMAQPALLVLKEDGTVLESWAIVPSTVGLAFAYVPFQHSC